MFCLARLTTLGSLYFCCNAFALNMQCVCRPVREEIEQALKSKNVASALFERAQAETLEYLRLSAFPDFRKSQHYEKAVLDMVRITWVFAHGPLESRRRMGDP